MNETEVILQELEKQEEEMEAKRKKICENIGKFLGCVGGWFLSALLIWWGWNILAPHINLFTLEYWEMFAIRMAFSSVVKIIALNFTTK